MLLSCTETLLVHLQNIVTSQLLFGLLRKVTISLKLMLFCYIGTWVCVQTGLCCLEHARSHPTGCKTDLKLLNFTWNCTGIRRWQRGQDRICYAHHYKVLFFQVLIPPSLGQSTARAFYLFLPKDDASALSCCSTSSGEVFIKLEQSS